MLASMAGNLNNSKLILGAHLKRYTQKEVSRKKYHGNKLRN